jgi:hypothetical protein
MIGLGGPQLPAAASLLLLGLARVGVMARWRLAVCSRTCPDRSQFQQLFEPLTERDDVDIGQAQGYT